MEILLCVCVFKQPPDHVKKSYRNVEYVLVINILHGYRANIERLCKQLISRIYTLENIVGKQLQSRVENQQRSVEIDILAVKI